MRSLFIRDFDGIVKGPASLQKYVRVCVFLNKIGVRQPRPRKHHNLTHTNAKEHVCVCITELQKTPSFEHYTLSDKAMDYRILFMDEDQDRMYVGCKDHVLSMDINNISQTTLKVREQSTLLYINMKCSRTLLQLLKNQW